MRVQAYVKKKQESLYGGRIYNLCVDAAVPARYVPARHNNDINTQIVYMATIQTSCNNNHFITLDNFHVLRILLILTRAAIVLM